LRKTGRFDPSLPFAFKPARLLETAIEVIFTEESASGA
jgi:DNA-binding XRE family transcriptional regulator